MSVRTMYVRTQSNGYREIVTFEERESLQWQESLPVRKSVRRTFPQFPCLQESVAVWKMVSILSHISMSSTAKVSSELELSPSAAKLRLLKRLRCTLRYEKKAWASGAAIVAGVDEVGRGSLFGPVVAAAVILERGYRIRGLRDSKLLPRERREVLAPRIRDHCVAWAVAAVDAALIEQVNIYQASRLGMRDAVMRLQPAAD